MVEEQFVPRNVDAAVLVKAFEDLLELAFAEALVCAGEATLGAFSINVGRDDHTYEGKGQGPRWGRRAGGRVGGWGMREPLGGRSLT